MEYLAIDFGLRHLGLAVNVASFAEPLQELSYKDISAVLPRIKLICAKQGIDKVIIGISEGKMAETTRQFGKRLANFLGLPVFFQDETLSTQEAQRRLAEGGMSQKKRANFDHQAAATLILQDFLDKQQSLLLK